MDIYNRDFNIVTVSHTNHVTLRGASFNTKISNLIFSYINKNIRKSQYYKEHKEEVEDIISWLKEAHGDE